MLLDSETAIFMVVINHEAQYSIWPEELDLPAGWEPTGVRGTRSECLSHISSVWTDMRPRSLREFMAA